MLKRIPILLLCTLKYGYNLLMLVTLTIMATIMVHHRLNAILGAYSISEPLFEICKVGAGYDNIAYLPD